MTVSLGSINLADDTADLVMIAVKLNPHLQTLEACSVHN